MRLIFCLIFLQVCGRGFGANDCVANDSLSPRYTLRYFQNENFWRVNVGKPEQNTRERYLMEYPEFKEYGITLEQFAFSPQFSFKDSLEIRQPGRFKVAQFLGDSQVRKEVYFELVAHKAIGLPVRFLTAPDHAQHVAKAMITDGVKGNLEQNEGNWLGWHQNNMEITLDLEQMTAVKSVVLHFLQNPKSNIYLPETVEFYTSDDGVDWQLSWINAFDEDLFKASGILKRASIWDTPFQTNFRFLKVVAKPYQKGSARLGTIMADELIVK